MFQPSLTMRGLLPPTPSGTPRGARLVRSPGEAGQRQGSFNHIDNHKPCETMPSELYDAQQR
eukprot:1190070-Prorocentrum_minimum.AAC.3